MSNMIESAANLIRASMHGKGQFTVKQAADKTKTWSVTSQALGLLVKQGKAARIRRGTYSINDDRAASATEPDDKFAARIAAFIYDQLGEKDTLRLLSLVEQRPRVGEESTLEFALAEEISRHS